MPEYHGHFAQAVALLATQHERHHNLVALSEEEAALALQYFHLSFHSPGEEILGPESASGGECLFVIVGEVMALVRIDGTEQERMAARTEPGDFMGHLGLFDGGARVSRWVADAPCAVGTISRQDFLKLSQEYPSVAFKLTCLMAAQLARFLRNTSWNFNRYIHAVNSRPMPLFEPPPTQDG